MKSIATNMDLKIIVFCIFLQYELSLCSKVTDDNSLFPMYLHTTAQEYTDRDTYFYIENRKTREGRMDRLRLVVNEHICQTSPQMRDKMCELLLEYHIGGFTLDSTDAPLKCNRKSRTIHFPTLKKSRKSKLWMYSCPPFLYTDLVTGAQKTFPYVYTISNGRTYDSAIFFVQKDAESKDIYPLKYLKNINFKQLRPYRIPIRPKYKISETRKDMIISSHLQDKQLNSPYEKFKYFYSSINICGLKRVLKMNLCKQSIGKVLRNTLIQFDLLGYNEAKCRKYRVRQSKVNQGIENNPEFRNQLYMFRCPPLNTDFILRTPKYMHLYYVASNLSYHSIALFSRDNDKKELPTRVLNLNENNGLKMQPIFEHILRERFLPQPLIGQTENIQPQKSHQEVEDEINASDGDVRMPFTLKRLIKPNSIIQIPQAASLLQFTRDRWLADHVSSSFSKVKMTNLKFVELESIPLKYKNNWRERFQNITSFFFNLKKDVNRHVLCNLARKHVYSRFMSTYKSIDICELSAQQITLLCNKALDDLKPPGDKYLFDLVTTDECSRRKVTLTVLEADDYETNQFSLWACRSTDYNIAHDRLYFVGKNHLKDSATIYKRIKIQDKEYYYPHTLITKIDRYKLIDDVLLRIPSEDYLNLTIKIY